MKTLWTAHERRSHGCPIPSLSRARPKTHKRNFGGGSLRPEMRKSRRAVLASNAARLACVSCLISDPKKTTNQSNHVLTHRGERHIKTVKALARVWWGHGLGEEKNKKPEWTVASPSVPPRTICHWGLFKRSCQQVVQLSAHPRWSVGALLTERKERHREGSEGDRKKNVVGLFICPSLWQPCRGCHGRKINAGQADSHSSLFGGLAKSSSQGGRGAQSFPLW